MNKKLKIAFIGWAYSIHLQRFSKWFASRGHEVNIFSDRVVEIPGVKVTSIHILPRYIRNTRYGTVQISYAWISYIGMILKLRKAIKELNPDILHIHTLYLPAQLGVFANFKPMVVMPWNGDIIWKKNRSFFHTYLVKKALRSADLIPLQTEYLKNRCIELGADEKKIELIQFGVDLERFQFKGDIEAVKSSLNIDTTNVIISTRNIHYNVIKIVEAIPMVLEKIPDATFVFIWPNLNTESDTISILKRIKELKVEKFVKIIGHVDKHDSLAKYLSIARTFVSVSTIDCFPQTALEAMTMRVLPVMGDIPPIRTYIRDGENGILVNPLSAVSVAEGIISSLKLPENKRMKMLKVNYQLIKDKADFNKEMAKMENLYYQLIENRKKRKNINYRQ